MPAGGYTIETEEESIDSLSFLAFRRVATTLIERPPKNKRGPTRFWEIDPDGLASALERDAEQTLENENQSGKPTTRTPVPNQTLKSDPPHE